MKKVLITTLVVIGLAVPLVAFAAPCANTGLDPLTSAGLFGGTQYCTATSLAVTVIKVLLSMAAMVAVLFIVIGGFRYIMASDDKAVGSAKKTLTNAIIGLVIIILAYTIVAIVVNTAGGLGTGGGGTNSTTNNTSTTDTGSAPNQPSSCTPQPNESSTQQLARLKKCGSDSISAALNRISGEGSTTNFLGQQARKYTMSGGSYAIVTYNGTTPASIYITEGSRMYYDKNLNGVWDRYIDNGDTTNTYPNETEIARTESQAASDAQTAQVAAGGLDIKMEFYYDPNVGVVDFNNATDTSLTGVQAESEAINVQQGYDANLASIAAGQ